MVELEFLRDPMQNRGGCPSRFVESLNPNESEYRMIGLFSRAPRQARPSRPSFRPTLERLEERDCPTTLTLGVGISSTSKTVVFYGAVSNTPILGGVTVQLSGVASGTATTASDGSFSILLTASGLGTESAATTDATAQTAVTDQNAPLINLFQSTEYMGGYYLFNGHVNGTIFPGEQVTFGGQIATMNGQTATVDSNGDFSFVGHLLPTEEGCVTATATADAWGVNNTASNSVDQQS
jgi:hypothetical protein